MTSKRRFQVLLTLLLLVSASLLLQLIEIDDAAQRLQQFPRSGLGFASKSLRLTDLEKEMIGKARALKAVYHWKGRRYAITVIDGTHDRHAVHDPRYCFRGAGWSIQHEKTVPCLGGQARQLQMSRDGERTEALFFYSDGRRSFDQPLDYWFQATKRRWLRRWGGPEPVLVMVQPLSSTSDLGAFLRELLPALSLP
jgi:hypothetical protein